MGKGHGERPLKRLQSFSSLPFFSTFSAATGSHQITLNECFCVECRVAQLSEGLKDIKKAGKLSDDDVVFAFSSFVVVVALVPRSQRQTFISTECSQVHTYSSTFWSFSQTNERKGAEKKKKTKGRKFASKQAVFSILFFRLCHHRAHLAPPENAKAKPQRRSLCLAGDFPPDADFAA